MKKEVEKTIQKIKGPPRKHLNTLLGLKAMIHGVRREKDARGNSYTSPPSLLNPRGR